MSQYQSIITNQYSNYIEVIMNRAEVHNAFDPVLIKELTECFQNIDCEKNIFCLLKSEGKSFSAGADLNWMKESGERPIEENTRESLKMSTMFQTLNSLKIPLIGVVQGAALGGGLGLVSVCDYVLASEKAFFGFSEVKLGLIPAVISPYAFKKIGPSQARALFISGETFNAKRAYSLGLVHHLSEPEDLEDVEMNLIASFTQNAPIAMKEAKKLYFQLENEKIDNESLASLIATIRSTDEAKEGMSALLEKRKANWSKS